MPHSDKYKHIFTPIFDIANLIPGVEKIDESLAAYGMKPEVGVTIGDYVIVWHEKELPEGMIARVKKILKKDLTKKAEKNNVRLVEIKYTHGEKFTEEDEREAAKTVSV